MSTISPHLSARGQCCVRFGGSRGSFSVHDIFLPAVVTFHYKTWSLFTIMSFRHNFGDNFGDNFGADTVTNFSTQNMSFRYRILAFRQVTVS